MPSSNPRSDSGRTPHCKQPHNHSNRKSSATFIIPAPQTASHPSPASSATGAKPRSSLPLPSQCEAATASAPPTPVGHEHPDTCSRGRTHSAVCAVQAPHTRVFEATPIRRAPASICASKRGPQAAAAPTCRHRLEHHCRHSAVPTTMPAAALSATGSYRTHHRILHASVRRPRCTHPGRRRAPASAMFRPSCHLHHTSAALTTTTTTTTAGHA